MKTIAIAGLGLIGGSLALMLSKNYRVIGYDTDPQTLSRAIARGAIAEGSSDPMSPLWQQAELLILATPMAALLETAALLAPQLTNCQIVLDVASVKAPFVHRCREIFSCTFIGGHPMAGNEHQGFDAANEQLLRGAVFFLTPTGEAGRSEADAIAQIKHLLSPLAFRFVEVTPEVHDQAVAHTSHLPYFVASALAAVNRSRLEDLPILDAAASGFRDTTRLAAGNPELGCDMAVFNREALLPALDQYIACLQSWRSAIAAPQSEALSTVLRNTQQWRKALNLK